MNYITKSDINQFGSYVDRKDNFDDDKEIDVAINFLSQVYENDPSVTFKSKPFGKYDVDLGVYWNDKLVISVDVERWSAWTDEWPNYYSHVSFLGRKEKFLRNGMDFLMMYFNFDLTKLILIDKQTILKYPTIDRHTKSKIDRIKKVSFDDARLYGSNLTQREKSLFKQHRHCKLK
jgi:hypothetical protein